MYKQLAGQYALLAHALRDLTDKPLNLELCLDEYVTEFLVLFSDSVTGGKLAKCVLLFSIFISTKSIHRPSVSVWS